VSNDLTEGQILTVFRSRLAADANPEYSGHAEQMSTLAQTMPGYVDHKTFTAEDGERVTIVTFTDRESHEAWRLQTDHVQAQRAGIAAYYDSYSLQVATVDRVSLFARS
jgi:heme-degrading monooxygenase HmoA